MIQFTKNRILCGLLALCASVCLPEKSFAQGGIDTAWSNSLTAMRAKEWAKAHAILAKATGAQIIASPLAAPVLESGMVSDEDPQADAGRPAMAPVKVARIIQDGETLTLGDIAITAHATPGHTPGAISLAWGQSGS